MEKTILQVPLTKQLRKDAEGQALEQGFSSLQEAVRVFLKKFAQGTLGMTFEEKSVQLSPKAIKRYNKMIDEIDNGLNVYSAENVDDLMRHLHDKS